MTDYYSIENVTYFPSYGELAILIVALAVMVIIFMSKVRTKLKQRAVDKPVTFVVCFLFLLNVIPLVTNYLHYSTEKDNYQNGRFSVISGAIEEVYDVSGASMQYIKIDGIRLFSNKGDSTQINSRFSEILKIGDEVVVHYGKHNRILKVTIINT